MRARLLVAACALALLGGCASTILLESEPPGARVVVDGAYLGRTPVRYTDTAPVGTVHRVDLYLQGYDDLHGSFARNGPINPGAVCGGLVCLVPLAWVQDYPRSRRFLMRRLGYGSGQGQGQGGQGGDQSVPPPYPGWRPPSPRARPPRARHRRRRARPPPRSPSRSRAPPPPTTASRRRRCPRARPRPGPRRPSTPRAPSRVHGAPPGLREPPRAT